MKTLAFLWIAYRGYKKAIVQGSNYSAVIVHGVPNVCIFIGIGRSAWAITNLALEKKLLSFEEPQ